MSDSISRKKLIPLAGFAALLGVVLGIVADTCLLYSPTGGYETGDFLFMKDFGQERLLWGHYLGILAIPLLAAAIWLVWLALAPAGKWIRLAASALGVYIIFPGVTYHGAVYAFPSALRAGTAAEILPFTEALAAVFAGGFFLLIIGLCVLILRGKTLFPKWMALATPLVTYPLWVAAYFLVPTVGNFLLPAGFNLSMGIFVGFMLFRRNDFEIENRS